MFAMNISYYVDILYSKLFISQIVFNCMTSAKSENKSIELVFPRPKRDIDMYLPKIKGEDFFQIFSTDFQSIAQWFSDLRIENIINSSQTTKLILGSKGENGGLTVVLKPNKPSSSDDSNIQASQQIYYDNKEED
jgi:hypothetical protein